MGFVREGNTVVHSMDRLARNLVDARNLVQNLRQRDIGVEFVKAKTIFTCDDFPIPWLM